MPHLLIVIASTRPGRVGLPLGEWFAGRAEDHGGFTVEVADLAELGLPLFDEPNHPRLRRYEHPHTLEWSAIVDRADAVVFVTPEYNHAYPASVKNAIDYLHHEWRYKPASVVSYGGVSAGTRSAMALHAAVYALNLFTIAQQVNIPFVHSRLIDGRFDPSETTETAATAMLDELVKVAGTLKQLRA